MLLLLPLAAWAGGVVTNCTEAELRAAMAGGGVVTFACDGTILLANTITNDSDISLDGSGRQIMISGNGVVRVFCVNTNVTFTMANLTISGGKSLGGSAVLNLGGTVNLTGVSFRSNTATISVDNDALSPKASGGAIFNRGGTVNARNCSFSNNTAHTSMASDLNPPDVLVSGGAIRNEAGQVALQACTFLGNRASGGAAYSPSLPGDPAKGGAIHNSGILTLDLCTFAGNSASGGAGGGDWYLFPGGAGAEGSGGAAYNEGTLTAERTTLAGNTASGGSGGGGGTGDPYLLPAHGFPGGSGGEANGAAICSSGSLWVACSTFASNVVTGGAGGHGGDGSEFADVGGDGARGGDGGSGLGGALFNSGAASLVNCTIAYDTGCGGPAGPGGNGAGMRTGASGSGGDGGNGGSGLGGVEGTCNLTNCTIAWNRGNAGSGGAGGAGSSGNPVPGTPGTSGSAWGGTACGPVPNTLIASNTPAGGDCLTDPKLGPLADNGGPTLTMALLPDSPAIDAGDTLLAPTTDQRGFPRPAGLAADIGAFEYGSAMPTLTISRSGAAELTLLGNGNADQWCRLLCSSNLLDWTSIATNELGSDGTVIFHDSLGAANGCRFYRLAIP